MDRNGPIGSLPGGCVIGPAAATRVNLAPIRAALEAAGVEFIEENGGGPGVRLRKGIA